MAHPSVLDASVARVYYRQLSLGSLDVEIVGYSERGLLNPLFYEIRSSPSSLQLLANLLSLIYFPRVGVDFRIRGAKILIEQSFSDFGDADAVLLIDNEGAEQSIIKVSLLKQG